MDTTLSILLLVVVVVTISFLLLLFRLPSLEEADTWLKYLSGVVAAFTFIAGISALYAGKIVNDRQAEKLRVLEKEAAVAKRSYLELQERVQWRKLTPEQSERFSRSLSDAVMYKGLWGRSGKPKTGMPHADTPVRVWWVGGDPEAGSFALQLSRAMGKGFFVVSESKPVDFLASAIKEGTGIPSGLSILLHIKLVTDPEGKFSPNSFPVPPEAVALQNAFKSIGFDVPISRQLSSNNPDEMSITLIVGSKP